VQVGDAFRAHHIARRALRRWQRLAAGRGAAKDNCAFAGEHLERRRKLLGFVGLKVSAHPTVRLSSVHFWISRGRCSRQPACLVEPTPHVCDQVYVVSMPKNPNRRYRTARYYPLPTTASAADGGATRPWTGSAGVSGSGTGLGTGYRLQRPVVATPAFHPVEHARAQMSQARETMVAATPAATTVGLADAARAGAAAIASSQHARTYSGAVSRGPGGRAAAPWDDEAEPRRIKVLSVARATATYNAAVVKERLDAAAKVRISNLAAI
jgi:hypothetical protein